MIDLLADAVLHDLQTFLYFFNAILFLISALLALCLYVIPTIALISFVDGDCSPWSLQQDNPRSFMDGRILHLEVIQESL